MQRQSKFSCSPFCVSAFRPQMPGNVEGTVAPVEPVTLARGEDSTPGQAVDCMQDLVAVCTLVRAEDSMQVQAAECMLAQAEVFTQGQEVGFMLGRVVESILAHPPIMATKAHGGLALPEPKAANGLDKTVLNEASQD